MAIEEKCRAGNCILKMLGRDVSVVWNPDNTFDYHGIHRTLTRLTSGLAGRYQSGNAAVALAAAEVLEESGMNISATAFKEGIAAARWPGRMELVPGSPPLLLDGAHNPAGASALAEALKEYSYSRLLLVTGVCDDKDIDRIYTPLIPLVDCIYTVTPAVERAMPDQELSLFFHKLGIVSQPCGSVTAGICTARSEASEADLILVCGSLFVVGEVKAWLEQVNYSGIRG
jgi:dihydrofolate synthase/folylpolyglutamate synthase